MFRKIWTFFDKFEDRVRAGLSHFPIVYALVGAVGIVLVWKGVWEMAETIPGMHGFPSVVMGVIILLASGLLVSFFIGDSIIISGFKHEKKLAEKTEAEVKSEQAVIQTVVEKLDVLEGEVKELIEQKEEVPTK